MIWYGKNALDYEDTAFNPRELSGICLSCRVSQADADDLAKLAKKLGPQIDLFKGRNPRRPSLSSLSVAADGDTAFTRVYRHLLFALVDTLQCSDQVMHEVGAAQQIEICHNSTQPREFFDRQPFNQDGNELCGDTAINSF